MSNDQDAAAKEAAELLPCGDNAFNRTCNVGMMEHSHLCPAFYRPAVAEALRKRDAKLEQNFNNYHKVMAEYRADIDKSIRQKNASDNEVDDLRAQLERYKNDQTVRCELIDDLRTQLAEAEKRGMERAIEACNPAIPGHAQAIKCIRAEMEKSKP